jgi:drug/metabolite transporter (DMT)-like permease
MDLLKNGVLIAIVAHGLIGVSLVWDKVLLKQPQTKNLLAYVFWLGAISVFGVVLVPFGFKMPALGTIVLAFGSGVLHLLSVFFYMAALKRGEASETPAIMGGFSPVATALLSAVLLPQALGGRQIVPFALMALGGFVMFFSENLKIGRILPLVTIAAGTFGLLNVLQKVVFNHTNFVSGYVFFTIGTFVAALCLLIPPSWRRQILQYSQQAAPSSRFWYFVNRFIAGVGSFLVFFAISRANPAVVDAIAGVRYAIIFIAALLLTKFRPRWLCEEFHGRTLWGKLLATGLIIVGLATMGTAGEGNNGAGSPAG